MVGRRAWTAQSHDRAVDQHRIAAELPRVLDGAGQCLSLRHGSRRSAWFSVSRPPEGSATEPESGIEFAVGVAEDEAVPAQVSGELCGSSGH